MTASTPPPPPPPIGAAPVARSWGVHEAIMGWIGSNVLGLVFGAVIIGAAGYAGAKADAFPLWLLAIAQVPLWAGMLGTAWFVATRRGDGFERELRFRFAWPDALLGPVIGLACQFVLVPVVSWPVVTLAGKKLSDLDSSAVALTDKAKDPLGIVLLVLIVAIGAPVVEELFYRGVVLGATERRWGTVVGIAATGVVFGLSHVGSTSALALPALAAFGAVLAFVAVRTGRLGAPILAHLTFNTVTVIALLTR